MFAKLTLGAAIPTGGKCFVNGRDERKPPGQGLFRSSRAAPYRKGSFSGIQSPMGITFRGDIPLITLRRLPQVAWRMRKLGIDADRLRLCLQNRFCQRPSHGGDADTTPAGVCDASVVITENLTSDQPVTTAELAAIETYLADALDEIFGAGPAIAPPISPIS